MWHLKKKKKCNNNLCLNLHNFCYYFCYIYLGFQGKKNHSDKSQNDTKAHVSDGIH